MKKQILVGAVLTLISSVAFAHPGHNALGYSAGFMHPFTGWDHLLVMLAVGVLAAKTGGSARWQLPLTFVLGMAVGAALGVVGFGFAGLETTIAATVIAMSLLLILNIRLQTTLQITLVAAFALLHGMAHGVELQSSAPTMVGMMLATGLLHGIGLLSGLMHVRSAKWIQQGLAVLMLFVGGYLVV